MRFLTRVFSLVFTATQRAALDLDGPDAPPLPSARQWTPCLFDPASLIPLDLWLCKQPSWIACWIA